MNSQNIINVNEANFEYEVINFSHKMPVVVDFWAEWCVPCKMLDPILRKLAQERGGDFRLARVNVDENQKLAIRYNVRGIPNVKAFRNGNFVSEFSGVQAETKIRQFLNELIPSPLDLNLDKANSLLAVENWRESYEAFRQVLKDRPGHSNALLGLSKTLLVQGRASEARDILNSFPVSPEFSSAEKLMPLAKIMTGYKNQGDDSDDPAQATYHHALKLISMGNLPAAMDGILDILSKDKNYRNGEAKLVILSLFEILGPNNPTTREYQTELASILF